MMKSFNVILLLTTSLFVGLCAVIIVWAQPINGDLTRIGAYPERWFGWSEQQQKIPDGANTAREPGKRHILVIGDSFSEAGRWQAVLGEKYSFEFFHAKNMYLPQLAARIQRDKPDGVVIESVERFTLAMFGPGSNFMGKTDDKCQAKDRTSSEQNQKMPLVNKESLPTFPMINRKTFPASGKEISQGFHYMKLWSDFLRKPKKRKAKILDLTTGELFSNQRSNQLLVIVDDLLLNPDVVAANLKTAQCSLQTIADTLSKSGTPYAILMIPDKATAYQPYLAREDLRQITPAISQIAAGQPDHTIDMLPAIREKLASGEKDFYLPNDTHWSYKGFQLAGLMIEAELASQWSRNATKVSAP